MFNPIPATPLILRDLAIDVSVALAGAAILAFGLLTVGAKSQSPALKLIANHLRMALAALAPAAVATVAWPILYLGTRRQGAGIALMLAALALCVAWAWIQTRWITRHLTELMGPRHERLWKTVTFAGQTLAVLASGPLFFGTLFVLKVLQVDIDLS